MISRRGLLGSLGLLLAAPAIIRTSGLLMPISAPRDFSTADISVIIRYTTANGAWSRTFGTFAGTDVTGGRSDMRGFGFDLTEQTQEDAMRHMAEMREIEAKMTADLEDTRNRLSVQFTPQLWL
jgi:hypothetical protein